MNRAVHFDTVKSDRRTNRQLAFGVFAAPAGWLIHGIAGTAIVGRSCQAGGSLADWQWAALISLTVLACGLAIAGAFTAYRVFRRWRRNGRVLRAEGWDRVEFLALFGLFLSFLLLLNIVYFGVMPVIVEPCVRSI